MISEVIDLNKYDFLVVRYSVADKSGIALANNANLITEHHTASISEISGLMENAPSLLKKIFLRIKMHQDKKYGPRMLALCRGIIGVTDEIRKVEMARTDRDMHSITLLNGIDVERTKLTGFAPFDGKHLELVFMTSGSFPWNGLDRIAQSIRKYKGPVEITFHILGEISRREMKALASTSKRIEFHGLKIGDELDTLMARMNLAVSSLALFRKNMNEACPLKTREYVARGIPFVMAYHDDDLSSVEIDRKFFLSFPNDNSPIEIQRIIDFAGQMSNNATDISQYMREYAVRHLDLSGKTERFIEFVESLATLNPCKRAT